MKGALWEEDTSINGAHFSITGALWEEKQGGPISINGSCSSMACALWEGGPYQHYQRPLFYDRSIIGGYSTDGRHLTGTYTEQVKLHTGINNLCAIE